MNASEGLSANHAGPFGRRTIQRFKQWIVLVSVAMGPSVHGNRLNVASGVESASSEHASELIANVSFENIKGRGQQLVASCAILVFCCQTGLARSTEKMKKAGILGRAGEMIVADGDREIKRCSVEVSARRVDGAYAQLLKGFPISDLYVGVDQRNFDRVRQRFFLPFRHLRTEVGNDHVVTSEYTMSGLDLRSFSAVDISDFHRARALRIAKMLRPNDCAVETNADWRVGMIQPRIVDSRGDDVFHCAAGRRTWHQRAHQQPRDRGVPIREMEDVGLSLFRAVFTAFQLESLESRIVHLKTVPS